MQYVLLMYQNEAEGAKLPAEGFGDLHREFMEFAKSIAQSGNLKANSGLRPVSTATTVRVRR